MRVVLDIELDWFRHQEYEPISDPNEKQEYSDQSSSLYQASCLVSFEVLSRCWGTLYSCDVAQFCLAGPTFLHIKPSPILFTLNQLPQWPAQQRKSSYLVALAF